MSVILISSGARNVMLDSLASLLNGGTLKLYSGAIPSSPATPPAGGDILLATLKLSNPATLPARGGEVVFEAVAQDDSAAATGVAAWGRLAGSDGVGVIDGDVGVDDGFIRVNTVKFVAGGPVRATSATLSVPASMSF